MMPQMLVGSHESGSAKDPLMRKIVLKNQISGGSGETGENNKNRSELSSQLRFEFLSPAKSSEIEIEFEKEESLYQSVSNVQDNGECNTQESKINPIVSLQVSATRKNRAFGE